MPTETRSKPAVDTRPQARAFHHPRVRHARRVRDETLDAAQGFRQGKALQAGQKCVDRGFPARQFETQHGAETALLPTCNVVTGIAAEAGIVDALDLRLLAQEFDHSGRCFPRVRACVHAKAAHAAQRKKIVERRAGHADGIGPPAQALMQLIRRGDYGAADNIAVSVQVLGGRVHGKIRAERQRLLPKSATEKYCRPPTAARRPRGRQHR